jgi:hypothetical protein
MPISTSRKLLPLLTALVLSAVLAVPALAGSAGSYSGKTVEAKRPVTFKVSGGKVRAFTAGVNLYCIGEGIEFNAVIPPGPLPLKNGKFSYEGEDSTGGSEIEISGTVTNKGKASGKVQMQHTKSGYNGFTNCLGTAKWSASLKK